MTLTLSIRAREPGHSPEALRAQGLIPAVFYGPKEASTPVSIDAKDLERVWREAGETTIVSLKGIGEDKDTLIHDVQLHPVTGTIVHVDFYALEKGKKVEIAVPLSFIGAAPAEKAGHIVVKALHEVEIEVAPQELPHSLEVDLSVLKEVGDHITASQITLPPSATLLTHGEEIVASVTEFVEEKEEAPAAAPEAAAAAASTETVAEAPGDKQE